MSSYYEKMLATGEVKCIDEEIPFEIPQGWEWCRLRDVIYPPKYGTSSKSLSNGDVPVLRMGNIQDGEVVYDKLVFSNNVEDNRKYLLQDGDLLFNRTNSAELVGKTAIFKGNRHVIYAGYLILLRPIKTNSEYLNYIFSSPYVRSYCKEVKTIGVQQCNINAEKVSQLLVPIAPFEEQMRIVDKIMEVLPSVDKYSISQYNLDLLNVSLSECLKKSILREAIQGRLVPQIAEEGTAKELLERIKKEKQKLVKEGKLKKSALATSFIFRGDDNKYYEQIGENCNDITDEIPFDLPYNWCWCRFSNIVSMTIGKTPARGEQTYWINGKYNWVSISDMVDGGSISTTKEKVSDLAVKEVFSAPISEKGSLLMSFKLSIGKTSILDIDAYHNEAIITIRPVIDKEYAMRNYLFKVLPLIANLGESKDAIKGKTLNSKSLSNLLIPLPPLQEQQRIIEQMNILSKQLR